MDLLESLIFSEYIRFLKFNKIVDINKYKKEYLEYLKTKDKENISEALKFFLTEKEKEEIEKIKIKK